MKEHNNIKIVLTRTWDPGNIGSVLRAMKNFDFTNITAVNQVNFDEEKLLKMAAGAKDQVKYLKQSKNLKEEVKDSQIVYAFTARKRKHLKIITPAMMAEEIFLLPEETKVSLLFGNETNGLNNEEIDLADRLVMIPTSENYSSLNLASAVLVALYEIAQNKLKVLADECKTEKPKILNPYPKEPVISISEKNDLYESVSSVIAQKLLQKKIHEKQFKENIKYLFNRMFLNKKEARFIKTIFKLIEKRIK